MDAHGCPACPHPAIGPAIVGSPDVNVNGRPALRVDDRGIHAACCGPNTWTATTGALTVFINGKAAHRQGDTQTHCGGIGKLMEGSPNVIVEHSQGGSGGGSSSSSSGGGGGGGSGSPGGSSGSSGGSSGSSGSGSGSTGSSGQGSDGALPGPDNAGPPADRPNTPIEPDEIEIHVVTSGGGQVDGIAYELTMPDGSTRSGTADVTGTIKLTGLTQRGDCKLRFPKIDDERSEQPE